VGRRTALAAWNCWTMDCLPRSQEPSAGTYEDCENTLQYKGTRDWEHGNPVKKRRGMPLGCYTVPDTVHDVQVTEVSHHGDLRFHIMGTWYLIGRMSAASTMRIQPVWLSLDLRSSDAPLCLPATTRSDRLDQSLDKAWPLDSLTDPREPEQPWFTFSLFK
jgi:hypothetical protein